MIVTCDGLHGGSGSNPVSDSALFAFPRAGIWCDPTLFDRPVVHTRVTALDATLETSNKGISTLESK